MPAYSSLSLLDCAGSHATGEYPRYQDEPVRPAYNAEDPGPGVEAQGDENSRNRPGHNRACYDIWNKRVVGQGRRIWQWPISRHGDVTLGSRSDKEVWTWCSGRCERCLVLSWHHLEGCPDQEGKGNPSSSRTAERLPFFNGAVPCLGYSRTGVSNY